ncbi:RNA polymerase sigma factor [Lutimonas zeaxanthinifaciens]|uniref:RNA polymerase sigma factor n=1 Tax=Lutimonas zeaxanthinifaciens TaxID=3060215 RepID=UPI00265C8D89|nr:RNA polymerase sigma factor [Lutimonas sp. YSD2104]WKK64834.1 RNA polymerase sigma factor [Lutimonas sp. YSD2104]
MQTEQQHIKDLLQACSKGSKTAQFEIYKLYYKAMYNSALRILQNTYDAEDVMQEAFLNAFTKLDSYKGEVPFGAWLKRIVINKSLTQLKKRNKLQEVNLEVVDKKLENEDEIQMQEVKIDYVNLKVKKVGEAMKSLKENYRAVLTLSLIEGYDNEEIAQIMNISNENCRTTISRAKSKLRKVLMESSVLN